MKTLTAIIVTLTLATMTFIPAQATQGIEEVTQYTAAEAPPELYNEEDYQIELHEEGLTLTLFNGTTYYFDNTDVTTTTDIEYGQIVIQEGTNDCTLTIGSNEVVTVEEV